MTDASRTAIVGAERAPCPKCGHDPRAVVTASWTLEIPRRVHSLNKRAINDRGAAGAKYRKQREGWAWDLRVLRVDQRIPHAVGMRRATLTRLYSGREQAFDQDNLTGGMKLVVDAMVREGLLVDDKPAVAEIHHLQVRAGQSGLLILLEELEGQ